MTNQNNAAQAAEPQTVLSFDERERILCQFIREPINHDREMAIAIEAATQERLLAPLEDYERVLADHRRLVRELDVLLNGDGAAAQASLCDIVAQVKRDGIKASARVADTAAIIRDVCELDPADEGPETISVSVTDLQRIIERHSAPVAGEAVGVVQPNGDTFRLSRPLPVGAKVYAAPQASEAGDDELVYLGATAPPVPAWLLKSALRISHYMATYHPGEWAIYGIQIRSEPRPSAQGGISG
ncbi:hypothetical protein [Achromobacter pulmonis]|uniref:hypothetical protein n=1 Tax=Achromobacter pulmonis TaxID=1389932 RepID=UPI003C70DCF9